MVIFLYRSGGVIKTTRLLCVCLGGWVGDRCGCVSLQDEQIFKKHKALKYWVQCYLAGVRDLVVGYRDDHGALLLLLIGPECVKRLDGCL